MNGYNPYAGVGAGLTMLAEGINRAVERKRQISGTAKAAEAFVKSNPNVLKELGMDEMDFKNMSARDKAFTVQGYMEGLGVKKFLAEQQNKEATLGYTKALADHLKGQIADRDSVTSFNQKISRHFQTPDTIRRRMDPALLMQFAGEANLPPRELDPNVLKMFAPQTSQFHPGSIIPVPGRPDLDFIVQSPSGAGSVVPKPEQKSEAPKEPQEQKLDGKPTGWALFPDGKYRQLPKQTDRINAAQFDTNGDGVLSQEEWTQAVLAEKTGGMYPGMKVPREKDGGAAPPSVGAYDEFMNWMKKRK